MFYIRFFISIIQEGIINEEEIALIGYMTFVVLMLSVMVIIFFVSFQKRKNKLLLDKIAQQKAYDAEMSRTQTEIQEATLKHVGRELHDNVGQLLAYAKMQLGMLGAKINPEAQSKLQETTKIVADSLEEVRALSKSLNNDVLLNMGFVDSLQNELNRLKRMSITTATLEIEGDAHPLAHRPHELVLFRILQEFFSNAVKYAEAESMTVMLDFQEAQLLITASDDGVGFDPVSAEKGSGLINMESRAVLIGANYHLKSAPQEGTTLRLAYPFPKEN
ncbi:sensor histidine kinase [Sediminibacter sp. Hel_I_10]|uniref:sensor histidine kinase n=1 Tax=Sediminibacter sp. Hel_I_10 TaxID=1392490 RepID=UPI0009DCB6EA|nr:sensor histidine kinase [Sediminibacter sp. Hel_I_10]